jgi:hypothetical protein
LIPCGWEAELVKISFTIPSVNLPVGWSCLRTMWTRDPGLISARVGREATMRILSSLR